MNDIAVIHVGGHKGGKTGFCVVGIEDFARFNTHKWSFHSSGYVIRRSYPEKKMIYLHREVNSTPSGFHTDHVNGFKIDNRKSNLRTSTCSQNLANQKPRKSGKSASRFKGVGWCKQSNKWRGYLGYCGISLHLGMFESEEDAARAYNAKAIELFGDHAKLNQI